jgi:hypothetical protein
VPSYLLALYPDIAVSLYLHPLQEVLLIENDINTSPFSPAVHECVPPLPWAVTEGDVADPNRYVAGGRVFSREEGSCLFVFEGEVQGMVNTDMMRVCAYVLCLEGVSLQAFDCSNTTH